MTRTPARSAFWAEIERDAVSGEEHDAGETGRDHHVVALEGRRLAVPGEVRLEQDLGDAARLGQAAAAPSAPRVWPPWQSTMSE